MARLCGWKARKMPPVLASQMRAHAVGAGGADPLAVRAVGDLLDQHVVAAQLADHLAGRDLVDADDQIGAAGDEALAVGREGDAAEKLGMPLKELVLLAVGDLPEMDRPCRRRRRRSSCCRG